MKKIFILLQLIIYAQVAINDNPTVRPTQASTSQPKTQTPIKPSIPSVSSTSSPSTPSVSSTSSPSTPSVSSTPSSPSDDDKSTDSTDSTPHQHHKSTTPGVLPDFQFFEDNKYPYLVFIHVKLPNGLSSNCVGTLIEPLIVLTSAHCTYKISPKHIMAYNLFYDDKHKRHIDHVYQHKSYSDRKQDHDVSILKLRSAFKDDNHHLVELSGTPEQFVGHNGTVHDCLVVGFSIDSEGPRSFYGQYLGYSATLDALHGPEMCPSRVNELLWKKWLCSRVDKEVHFLSNRGSPLICGGYQYGLFSYTFNGIGDEGPPGPAKENYYVFIHYYRDWIAKTIKKSTGNLIVPNNKLFNISIMILVYNFF